MREIEVLTDCEVALLADRRTRGPWGLAGGANGAAGKMTYAPRGVDRADTRKVQHRLRKGEELGSRLPAAEAGAKSKFPEEAEAMADDIAAQYLDEVRRQMRGYKRMGESAMAQLRDDDFFLTLDPESNSVAILVKHLAGICARA